MASSISTVLITICVISHCRTLQISITNAENVSSLISFELDGGDHVRLDGDAFVTDKNVIQLTDNTDSLNGGSAGRVVYENTIPLGMNSNFTTQFQFQIIWSRKDENDNGGDGLAFFMASQDYGFHVSYKGDDGWLGLYSPKNNGNSSNYLVAVEFDTSKSSWDLNNNHIGIDVNNITSEYSVPLPQTLSNGKIWDATIEYSAQDGILTVSAGSERKVSGNFSYKINLTRNLPPEVVVGFSAAAYKSSEIHRLISWKFTNVLISGSSQKKKNMWKVGLIAASAISLAVLSASFAIYRYTRRNRETTDGVEEEQDCDVGIELEHVPRKFTYAELSAGTSGFSEQKRIGQGGFGDVYKGILVQSDEIVAVKRISAGSKQGRKEYIAEISTITRLRHRNLVQLFGWCHEKGQLLLVYEYMPNGSLDNFLFGERNVELDWRRRYRIAIDIASALLYLHESWDECVVHRDIKSANVLLDSEFNAKVGDFGLARLVKHDQWFQTSKLAGTLGYMAAECAVTGIFSTESDLFSFGAVALEIACGRPALDHGLESPKIRLVEWVWQLHGEGRLFDAADKNLMGVYDRAELEQLMMIGLWCSHPDPFTRPKIRQVLQILNFEMAMPRLPSTLPKATYPPLGAGFSSQSSDFAAPSVSGSSDIPR